MFDKESEEFVFSFDDENTNKDLNYGDLNGSGGTTFNVSYNNDLKNFILIIEEQYKKEY